MKYLLMLTTEEQERLIRNKNTLKIYTYGNCCKIYVTISRFIDLLKVQAWLNEKKNLISQILYIVT